MRVRFCLYGRVQGVGFRVFARRAASRLGLAGYVRNRMDGGVEVEADGEDTDVRRWRAIVETGPPGSSVTRVEDVPPGDDPLPLPFEIRR
jgi:acylphosphatase